MFVLNIIYHIFQKNGYLLENFIQDKLQLQLILLYEIK